MESQGIQEFSNCWKPCTYLEYKALGDRKKTSIISNDFVFSLWAVTNFTLVETEVLVYPLTSLVAEFGGVLGLFLGVSFLTVWDGFIKLCFFLKEIPLIYMNQNKYGQKTQLK